jgi:alanine racemase
VTQTVESILNAVFALPGRSTRAIINLDALSANVRELDRIAGDQTALIAVVKANGYGHGAVMVARTALAAGAQMLGVATVGEAARLRAHDVVAPILLLGPCDPSEFERAISTGVAFVIGSQSVLEGLLAATERLGKTAKAHLKIDSGMHRFGFPPEESIEAAARLEHSEHVDLVALCTHLASADTPDDLANVRQPAVFEHAASRIEVEVGRKLPLHVANSAAIINGISSGARYARAGIAMYGLRPGAVTPVPESLAPVMSLVSRLARVHRAPAGSGVSYGYTYTTDADENVGLVPVGYADGYRRAWSNRAIAAVAGDHRPVRGRVCMDQLVIGALPDSTSEGDVVGLLGPVGGGPAVGELAGLAETIDYEIVTGIGQRVPRYFVSEGRVVAMLAEDTLSVF